MWNLWNILIFTFILVGTLMVSYGIYGIVYTRKLHVNAWIIRGLCFLLPAFYLYFNYKYNGKVVLTAIMPIYLTSLFSCSLAYPLLCGYLDRIREEYDATQGTPTDKDIQKYSKHMDRHDNVWNDPKLFWTWLKEESQGIAYSVKSMKKHDPNKVKNPNKEKKKLFGKKKDTEDSNVSNPVPVAREGMQIQTNAAITENVLVNNQNPAIPQSVGNPNRRTGQLQRPGHTGLLSRPGLGTDQPQRLIPQNTDQLVQNIVKQPENNQQVQNQNITQQQVYQSQPQSVQQTRQGTGPLTRPTTNRTGQLNNNRFGNVNNQSNQPVQQTPQPRPLTIEEQIEQLKQQKKQQKTMAQPYPQTQKPIYSQQPMQTARMPQGMQNQQQQQVQPNQQSNMNPNQTLAQTPNKPQPRIYKGTVNKR